MHSRADDYSARNDDGGLPELPVLDRYVADLKREGFAFDHSTVMIIVQHLLRTNVQLIRSMFDLGLAPERTFVLGKGYSTNLRCSASLRSLGVHVANELPPPKPGEYGIRREQEIDHFWAAIGADRLLDRDIPVLIDDVGGRLLRRAAQSPHLARVAGVEQTTSGVRRVEHLSLGFPVVNLARAGAKTQHESPLLAIEILRRMDAASIGNWPNGKICIVGNGSVGSALAKAMKARGIKASLFDVAPENLEDFTLGDTLPSCVAEADFVFGCTGQELFNDVPISAFQGGTTFVNCSSEDVEFAAILRQADRSAGIDWPAADVEVSIEKQKVTILNGGFPLNFDNSGVSLPEQCVQLTTALTLAGIVTASKHCSSSNAQSGKALIEIPQVVQDQIVAHYQRIVEWDGSDEGTCEGAR
jgi:S-adenosylhomocysteine hydrolase